MTVTPGRRLRQPLLQALLPYPAVARIPLRPERLEACPRPLPAARCPLAAAWLSWHHAVRARLPTHAPLAARVGAAVPGRRPPHHRPQGKCVCRQCAHLRGERGLLAAHLQEGEGR